MTPRVPTVNDLRVKLCYICREEERYDEQTQDQPRAWTHPCNCTLVAHEQCLLKWIQTSQGTSVRAANALKCPQCGAKYELESKYPVFLRVLAAGNKTLQQLGRLFTLFSVATFIGVVGSSVYIICTGYGAWAVRKFIGREMFDILLTDDPSNWPWTAYLNLPLFPISLVLSRMQSSAAIPPIIPILLVWPPSSPVGLHRQLLREYWTDPVNARQLALTALPPVKPWPPSPIAFGLFFVPLARIVYRRLYARLAYWLLGAKAASLLPGARQPNGAAFRNGNVDNNINVAIDDDEHEGEHHEDENPHGDNQQVNGADRDGGVAPAAAADRDRVGNIARQRQQGQAANVQRRFVWQWNGFGPLALRIRANVREVPALEDHRPLEDVRPRPVQALPQLQPRQRLEEVVEPRNNAAVQLGGREIAVEGQQRGDELENENVGHQIPQEQAAANERRDVGVDANPDIPMQEANQDVDQDLDVDLDANGDPAAAAVAAAEQQIEVNTTSLGRQVGGALLIPAISSFMGTVLFRLSRHSKLLREFLGVKVSAFSKFGWDGVSGKLLLFPPPPLGLWTYRNWDGMNLWQRVSLTMKLMMSAAWGGTRTWAESDPVWWRNSIGLGLFVVAKDCLQLLHLWLTKRELETRRVKNRDFSGVDVNELDLVPSWARP
ncbi:hypothetical protein AX17_005451 [Amanita inopinata Kibby_2008]|nr:hypothetical protein AX17_005451 [Amanita inopinata Kibby_2008]